MKDEHQTNVDTKVNVENETAKVGIHDNVLPIATEESMEGQYDESMLPDVPTTDHYERLRAVNNDLQQALQADEGDAWRELTHFKSTSRRTVPMVKLSYSAPVCARVRAFFLFFIFDVLK